MRITYASKLVSPCIQFMTWAGGRKTCTDLVNFLARNLIKKEKSCNNSKLPHLAVFRLTLYITVSYSSDDFKRLSIGPLEKSPIVIIVAD